MSNQRVIRCLTSLTTINETHLQYADFKVNEKHAILKDIYKTNV